MNTAHSDRDLGGDLRREPRSDCRQYDTPGFDVTGPTHRDPHRDPRRDLGEWGRDLIQRENGCRRAQTCCLS